MKTLISILALMVLLAGCDITQSADQKQRQRMDVQMAEAESSVSPPRVTKFTQLRDAVRIIELADDNISTWAYYMDMTGGLHLLCEAKGYGLPYSTQTTNPSRIAGYKSSPTTLPQAEPSGLFMPDNVAATWVLCVSPDGKGFDPVYWEPDLIVSPFELRASSSLKKSTG